MFNFQVLMNITVILMFWGCFVTTAHSAVPLTIEADVVGENLRFWWKSGHFLTTSDKSEHCLKPLEDSNTHPTPIEIDKWKEIGVECSEKSELLTKLSDVDVLIKAFSIVEKKIINVQIYHKDLLIAENTIFDLIQQTRKPPPHPPTPAPPAGAPPDSRRAGG